MYSPEHSPQWHERICPILNLMTSWHLGQNMSFIKPLIKKGDLMVSLIEHEVRNVSVRPANYRAREPVPLVVSYHSA